MVMRVEVYRVQNTPRPLFSMNDIYGIEDGWVSTGLKPCAGINRPYGTYRRLGIRTHR